MGPMLLLSYTKESTVAHFFGFENNIFICTFPISDTVVAMEEWVILPFFKLGHEHDAVWPHVYIYIHAIVYNMTLCGKIC